MYSITLDIPLLIGGLFVLLWLRFRGPIYRFQVACQVIGTFWAQYSFVVSWSLARLVPFISASTWDSFRLKYSSIYFPFVIYTIIIGIVSSFFWNIPTGVNFAYGEGRLWIQIAIFVSLILSTKAFAISISLPEATLLMWKGITLIGLIHGAAFLYQYVAPFAGLPFIGISRAHGLTLDGSSTGDVAAFTIGSMDILRPGGLAGEPKTVAMLFGIVLLVGFVGRPIGISVLEKRLSQLSLVLSSIGFIGAFSTSAFIGFAFAAIGLALLGVINARRHFGMLPILIIFYLFADYVSMSLIGLPMENLLSIRISERLSSGQMDPPIEAALILLNENMLIFFFGTGLGGGTFYVQRILNESFEYTLMPNIGIVALFLEFGLVGVFLLLIPFLILLVKLRFFLSIRNSSCDWERRFLLTLGVSVMAFMLTGSGIALGYPLAIGSVLGALNSRSTRRSET